jgi:peptidoglycan/LPS O-acetylase OafA/YrhL/uncharacterized protein involved in exopolysaccharide biosynthesis
MRLGCVEGARAYLALWVVICHVMWASGYEANQLSGLPALLRQGACAVDVFIVISAFVIFLLLDTKRPAFGPFIVRRFFRLFPLFIALFVIAIPLSRVSLWNLEHAAAYLTPEQIDHRVLRIASWWENLRWHIPLHAAMLQGAIPDAVLPESPGAFLDPAWSVSLEWQFYLVAPLAFSLAVSAKRSFQIALCIGCALTVIASKRFLPPVMYGAALPFHLEYFFLGAASYFVYKKYSGRARSDRLFPIACCLAVSIVALGGEARLKLIPVALWVAFLGLILEHRASMSWRLLSPMFTNRIAHRLGQISYSIYLSHTLMLLLLQYVLLRWAPGLSRTAHFWTLLALTTTATITASAALYRYLETPGIWAGRLLADRLERTPVGVLPMGVLPIDSRFARGLGWLRGWEGSLEPSIRLKRLVDIAWREKWWIGVPIVLCTAASLALVPIVPKTYRATTTILVSQESVPENIVRSTVTLRGEDWMRSLEQQVFTRAYLEAVARKLGMIGADAGPAEIESICRKLRAHIVPEIDKQNLSWFRISAAADDPTRAAGIANQVAEHFIAENARIRAAQSQATLTTTAGWESAYRVKLASGDAKVSEFTQQNLHEMPDQQPVNAQFLLGAQSRAVRVKDDIESRTQRLEALRLRQGRPAAIRARIDDPRQASLERELVELLGSYTDDNPLVVRKRAQIAAHLQSLPPVAAGVAVGDPALAAEIESVENELSSLSRELARENATIATYLARQQNAALLQPKVLQLNRGHEQARQQLDLAVARKNNAQHSDELEQSKSGAQFEIQDRAYPPKSPSEPDLGLFVLVGLGFGAVIGVGSTAARVFVNQTVRGEDEFATIFPDLPVYGVIPSLKSVRMRPGGVQGSPA